MGFASTLDPAKDQKRTAPSENEFEDFREKVLGQARAHHQFVVEGVIFNQGLTLVLLGDLTAECVSHLESVLEGFIRLNPRRVTVDLSSANTVDRDALQTIMKYQSMLDYLCVRLPNGAE